METSNAGFVQQLKDKLDIVDVISSYVPLQRKGRDYWACCPFHHEKTPSFQVKTFHQYYTCYGCGKRGDVINFVMEMDKLTFGEAIEKLAKIAGLEVPERAVDAKYKQQKEKLEKIYAVNREAALFYHNVLRTEAGEIALQYLAGRQLTQETIRKFGIGYSPDFNSLVSYLKGKGYSVETMREAGVVGVTDDGRPYDFFGKRLMIPIISASGKVIGFTGRSLEKKPDHAKYKNTSATLAFNKRKNLFGINMYKQYVPSGNRAMILVEGHMDVISLFQAGIRNVVASMGTALTPEQCKEIKRFADIVYVSYDGDSAGQAATLKGLSLLKDEGLEVKVVCLKDNLDPDDYVKKYGKDGYLKLVDEALPLVDFKLKKIEEKYAFNSYDERVKYVKEAVGVLFGLDEVEKAVYTEKVSKISGLSQDRIVSALQAESPQEALNEREKKEEPQVKETNALDIAEKYVLASMIFGKEYAMFGDAIKEYFDYPGHAAAFEYVLSCAKDSTMPVAARLYDVTDKEDADSIIGALEAVKADKQQIFYEECVKKLHKRYVDKEIKKTITELNTEKDEEKKRQLKTKLVALTQMKK